MEDVHFHFTILGWDHQDRMRLLAEVLQSLGDDCPFDVASLLIPGQVRITEPQPASVQAPMQASVQAPADNGLNSRPVPQNVIQCVVCFGTDPDKKAPCGCKMHLACTTTWLRRRATCPNPYCKRPCAVNDLIPFNPNA